MNTRTILISFLAGPLLMSCAKDTPSLPGRPSQQHVTLDVGMEGETKGAPVTDITSVGAVTLYGYRYTGSWSASCTPNFMSAEKVSYASSEWSSEGLYNGTVAQGSKVRFFAYAPFGAQGVSVPQSLSGPLRFSYTTPSDVSRQSDLLVSSSSEITGTISPVPMNFSHCLSAVTFRTGTETVTGTVKSISVIGIYSQAEYTIGSGWDGYAATSTFSAIRDKTVTEGSAVDLTDGELTMMLIPQTVPSGARIEVVVISGGEEHALTASIAGNLWEEGKSYMYSLSFDSISGMHIDVTPSSGSVSYGEYADFAVSGDPGWTIATAGSGFTAVKVDESTLRVTGSNYSGAQTAGTVTLTTGDSKRSASVSIISESLLESIALSPSSLTIEYGKTGSLTASGTFPGGYTVTDLAGVAEDISGNTVTLTNSTSSYTAVNGLSLNATTSLMGKTSNSVTVNLKPKPETISLSKDALDIAQGLKGSVSVTGDFDSFTATLSSTAYASLGTDGGKVTVTNSNDTYSSKTVTLTCTTDGDTGAAAECAITLRGLDDYVTGYIIDDITLSSTTVGAGGGTVTVSGGSVTQVWASGKTVPDFAVATFSCPGATVSGSTITIEGTGTTDAEASTFTVTASYSSDGISAGSRTAQFTRSANAITNGDHDGSDSDWKVSCSIGDGLTASGGSATVTASASHTHTYYVLYSSGEKTGPHTKSVTDEVSITLQSNGNSRFTISGNTIWHSDMGTEETTDKVTVRAANSSHTETVTDASASVVNEVISREEGSDSDHARSGDITYGEKDYGDIVYSEKIYGDEYAEDDTYGEWTEVGRDYENEWKEYDTHTEDSGYDINTGYIDDELEFYGTWINDPRAFLESPADSRVIRITASHTNTSYSDQRDALIVHYQRDVNTPYSKDWTRTAVKPYSRSASQECSYTHAYTLTYTSGKTSSHTETLSHTETWTDTGSDPEDGDSGTEHTRDVPSTEDSFQQEDWRYRSVATGSTTVYDTPVCTVSEPWMSWNDASATLGVSANSDGPRRTGTMTITNGDASKTMTVLQAGRQVKLILRNWSSDYRFWSFQNWVSQQEGTDHEMVVKYDSSGGCHYVEVEAGNLFYIEFIDHDFRYAGSTWSEQEYVPVGDPGATAEVIL